MPPLDDTQYQQFLRDGFVLVPNVFSQEQCAAALEQVELSTYGMRFNELLAHFDRTGEVPAKPTLNPPPARDAVEALIAHEPLLDLIEQCLGDKPSYINEGDFVRHPLADSRGQDGEHGGWHVDHWGFCYLPYSEHFQQYGYVNMWVFLHDIETDGAPVNVMPGSHKLLPKLVPRMMDAGVWNGSDWIRDIRNLPQDKLPKPVAATGKAGTVLIYNSYTLHRAVPFIDRRKQRALWHGSYARRDAAGFTHFGQTYNWETRKTWIPFWCRTTPRVRAIYGFPEPGDPYYTERTLKMMANWYPGMDLSPYYEAMKPSAPEAHAQLR